MMAYNAIGCVERDARARSMYSRWDLQAESRFSGGWFVYLYSCGLIGPGERFDQKTERATI